MESMNELISPKYLMKLVADIETAIWDEYGSHKQVENYIIKWHEEKGYYQNFQIYTKPDRGIDLNSTLHGMNGELLLKMAIDLGVSTPNFIPSVPIFKNEIKSDYSNAYDTFNKAFKLIETDPSTSIGLANSALESIVKEILKDNRFKSKLKGSETLYKLSSTILKEFGILDSEHPQEIKTIGSSLLSVNQAIEKLRSEKTNFHGKTVDDMLISDTMYTYFIVNSVSTVGLFLISFYKTRYPKLINLSEDDLPF